MRKIFMLITTLLLVLVGCSRNENLQNREKTQVSISLDIPSYMGAATRATDHSSAESGLANIGSVSKWIVAIVPTGSSVDFVTKTNNTFYSEKTGSNSKSYSGTAELVIGDKYDLYAYAVLKNDIATAIKEGSAITWDINDEANDFYCVVKRNFEAEQNTTITADLARPLGKLRLVATDYNTFITGKTITGIEIKYTNVAKPNKLNQNGTWQDATAATHTYTKSVLPTYTETDNTQAVFVDYIGVNSSNLTINSIQVTIKYKVGDAGAEKTIVHNITQDVPIKRNALTTIKGNLFTIGTNFTITITDSFSDNPSDVDFPQTTGTI